MSTFRLLDERHRAIMAADHFGAVVDGRAVAAGGMD
jgi:hypothetical protein